MEGWAKPETAEEWEAQRSEEFAQMEHKIVSESWLMFDMRWGVNLDNLVQTIDPLAPMHAVKAFDRFGLRTKHPLPVIGMTSSSLLHSIQVAMRARINQRSRVMPPIVEESVIDEKSRLFHSFQAVMRDEVPIVIDTRASFSLSPFKDDFIGPLEETNTESLQGLNSQAEVKGEGMVEWHVQDIFGVCQMVKTKAFFVPTATIWFFSPQTFFQEKDGGRLTVDKNKTVLTMPDDSEMEFPFNFHSNLPLMLLGPEVHQYGFAG